MREGPDQWLRSDPIWPLQPPFSLSWWIIREYIRGIQFPWWFDYVYIHFKWQRLSFKSHLLDTEEKKWWARDCLRKGALAPHGSKIENWDQLFPSSMHSKTHMGLFFPNSPALICYLPHLLGSRYVIVANLLTFFDPFMQKLKHRLFQIPTVSMCREQTVFKIRRPHTYRIQAAWNMDWK